MTILVGVKCSNGIVIGSDSAATSSAGMTPVMQIMSNDKIRIFGNNIVVATTGAVGNTQRLHHHVEAAIKGSVFRNLDKIEAATNISKRLLTDFASSCMPTHPQHGLGFGALVAAPIKGEPCLIEYASNNFQPELKQDKLFYVSMGSGQPLADPFLAFVSRVLWKDNLPDVELGKFGVYWTLNHTITLAPGMVGPPIKMAVLRQEGTTWTASLSEDTQEAAQFVAGLEERIGQKFAAPVTEADASPVPEPPNE